MAQARAHADTDGRIYGQQILFAYSTDNDGKYVNDHRNRRFYLRPRSNDIYLDYGKGFDNYTAWSDTIKGEDNSTPYQWMRDHRQVLIDNDILDTNNSRLNVDFVSGRMLLTDLLKSGAIKDTSYHAVDVELYRGTYYIDGISPIVIDRPTPEGAAERNPDIDSQMKDASLRPSEAAERNQGIDSQMKEASSHLLLKYLTSKDGRTPDDEPVPVDPNAAFYGMIKVNCGKHRMLVSTELQAERRVNIDEPPPKVPNQRNLLNVRSRERHRIVAPIKALSWWASNTIAGIPEIVCGLRDDKRRIIEGIEYIKTDRLASENYTKESWEPGACIRNMESLLSQIKELVQGDDPNTVYEGILLLESVSEGPRLRERLQNRRFLRMKLKPIDDDKDDEDDNDDDGDDDVEEKTLQEILNSLLEGND